jgi:hypothetical protein
MKVRHCGASHRSAQGPIHLFRKIVLISEVRLPVIVLSYARGLTWIEPPFTFLKKLQGNGKAHVCSPHTIISIVIPLYVILFKM